MIPPGAMKFFTVFTALIFCVVSCCRNQERKNYLLTEKHRQSVPYTDNQILKFKNALGEEFDVRVTRSEFVQNYDINGCAECCDELVNNEIGVTEFNCSKVDISFPVIAILPHTRNKNGSMFFYDKESFEAFRNGDFVEGDGLTELTYSENYELECAYTSECLEKFTIQNKNFDMLYKGYILSSASVFIKFYFYFEKTEGLVKIDKIEYNATAPDQILSVEEYFAI
jgi:hypothetical protein